jgi:biopolymer transport protein ExbB/TolQ
MITAFAVLPGGPGSSVQEMSGGISGALLTTQAGMVAALPLLLCHCWLQGQVRDTMHNATLCAGELEKIIARNK